MSHQYMCVYRGRPDLYDFIYQHGFEEAAETFLDILYAEKRLPDGLEHAVLVMRNGRVWETVCVQEVETIHRYREATTMFALEPGEDLRERAREGA